MKKMLPLTIEESKLYNEQKVYQIYKNEFNADDNNEVRDHCHCTGKYRGSAENIYNLRYKHQKKFL